MQADTELSIAKKAFGFLLKQHIDTVMPDPVGDYLRMMVENRFAPEKPAVTVQTAKIEAATQQPKRKYTRAPKQAIAP